MVAATCSEMKGSWATTLHAEGARAVGHFLADAAEPDDAERLAAKLRAHQALLVPDAALHRGIRGPHRAREREHQRPGVLGDADAVRAWGVHDDDAAVGGGADVDVVDAGAGAGDHPKTWRRGDELFVRPAWRCERSGRRLPRGRAASSFPERCGRASTVQPGTVRRISTAEDESESAMTTCMAPSIMLRSFRDDRDLQCGVVPRESTAPTRAPSWCKTLETARYAAGRRERR